MINADLGSGEFNSKQWHKSAIFGMDNISEVAEYVKQVAGKDVNKGVPLDQAKAQAIKLIGE